MSETNEPPRNLQEGWCPEGATSTEALAAADLAVLGRIKAQFKPDPADERTAAIHLHLFTGLEPSSEDHQYRGGRNRDGAVDIVLSAASGAREIVEVSQSLDHAYENSAHATKAFEERLQREYSGDLSWMIDLERGWEKQRLRDLAPQVAKALNAASAAHVSNDTTLTVGEYIQATVLGLTEPPIVYISSRNAGADNLREPYLDALSEYLASNKTIAGKLSKLTRERDVLAADRCHLYLGMASSGSLGGLLPTSPSYFTWGTFVAPSPLTDLWLHSGVGQLYHWTIEGGWVFHHIK